MKAITEESKPLSLNLSPFFFSCSKKMTTILLVIEFIGLLQVHVDLLCKVMKILAKKKSWDCTKKMNCIENNFKDK